MKNIENIIESYINIVLNDFEGVCMAKKHNYIFERSTFICERLVLFIFLLNTDSIVDVLDIDLTIYPIFKKHAVEIL